MRLNYTSLNRSPTSLSYLLSSGFKPASLFAQSEPGVWLDPSDVADLAWRRNLLTYSEQFDNAVWLKDGATITTNAAVAPDSTMTADGLVVTTRLYWFDNTGVIGVKIQSIYAKANLDSTLAITAIGGQSVVGGNSVVVNLTTGLSTSGHVSPNVIVTDAGNGWWRITVLSYVNTASGNSTYWTIGPTSGIYIWGAQLELGSTATPYQRISDVTTEVLERFPTTTLFQDTTGTTPVTTPGQPVGLVLDKSKGLVLGPELVTNGDFSSATGWTLGTGWSISGGTLNWAGAYNLCYFTAVSNAFIAGKYYKVTLTVSGNTSGNVNAFLNVLNNAPLNPVNFSGNGEKTFFLLAGVTCNGFHIVGNSATGAMSIDNISVREIPGNHATQATSASRPTYGIEPLGGRRNLLTTTEGFDSAAWIKAGLNAFGSGSVANTTATTDPVGGNTAEYIQENSASGDHTAYYTPMGLTAAPHTLTVYCKAAQRTWVYVRLAKAAGQGAYFNLSTGTIGTVETGITAAITSVGNGWYRCSVTITTDTTPWYPTIVIATGDNQGAYTGNGTSGIYVWGAQLELGSTATAYQRVGTAFDVTEAGVASVSYLSFDGVDDWLVTPTITPGTDKAQVFAGVRKLSDAALGMLMEFGTNVNGTVGTWGHLLPDTTSAGSLGLDLRGNGTSGIQRVSTGTAPASFVSSTVFDLSGATFDTERPTKRINGVTATVMSSAGSTDTGGGNFTTQSLFIGRRAGTSLPFNGQIYSLIVRFGANLATDQIASIESSVGSKTGFFAPTITGVPTIGVS